MTAHSTLTAWSAMSLEQSSAGQASSWNEMKKESGTATSAQILYSTAWSAHPGTSVTSAPTISL